MVLAGMGAPCPSGASVTHGAAPPGTWPCTGMGRHRELCVTPWDLSACFCTRRVEGQHLCSCALHSSVHREDVFPRAALGHLFFGSSWKAELGQWHMWLLVPGLWSSPQARLGVSTCLKQTCYLVYSSYRTVTDQGDQHNPTLLSPSDAFRTNTCPNFAERAVWAFLPPAPFLPSDFLFLALLVFPTLCPRRAVARRRAVQPPKPHSSPPARRAPAARRSID